MEQEFFITGYCRCLNSSRTVEVILADGHVAEVDCGYETCIHRAACPMAREIQNLNERSGSNP